MKKPYDEPTMIAVQYKTNLLESSPKGKFTNDALLAAGMSAAPT